ncbi:MAG: CapA family protein, partial [Chloroflexota bacterium]
MMAKGKVTVLMGGDLHVQRAEPESIFAHMGDELRQADIRFGNLEMMLTDIRKPLAGRDVATLVSDERMLAAYTHAGFDAVGLANNHSMDQGIEGLLRCIELLDGAGIIHTGGGSNLAEARRL